MRSPLGGPCELDSECVSGTWCGGETCVTCPPVGACRTGFEIVKRNGCDWCVPPNQCTEDSACGEENKCFPGLTCEAGCNGRPTCCHGNLCGDEECGPPAGLDCSVVGCADSGSCSGQGQATHCECVAADGGDDEPCSDQPEEDECQDGERIWSCDFEGTENQCVPAD